MIDIVKFVDSLGPLSISKDDAAVACEALRCEAIVEAHKTIEELLTALRAVITWYGASPSRHEPPAITAVRAAIAKATARPSAEG